ncbi:sensor histidine kinase [Aquimarina algicola]|uniref:histidine kinase n=1 Tax=Aquimarina algicola TaxID=2589995 RepID=A0A504JES9_9FLAO|nr:PAS domain-containing sensor histidine kinase [Aquimarina algicola]TPN89184.1 PAS domain S-box protein [Aquimarina algicola]
MEALNLYQILILLFQGAVVAFFMLLLFRLRKTMGLGILFASLGLFQFIQVFLASTIYFKISDQILVSPGSSVLFSASLFAVLLLYIKEDASTARKLIYALVMANIVLCFLLLSFRINIEGAYSYNPFDISTEFFYTNVFVLFVGTAILYLDSILIIYLFEFISKYISSLFFRIVLTMSIILSFDAFFFSVGSFWFFDNPKQILISGLISKNLMVLFYSIIFTIYLKFFEKETYEPNYLTFKDIFHNLTYKQKFEVAEKAIQLTENRYHTLTNLVPVGIFITSQDGKATYVNPQWCEISGIPEKEALGDGWLNAVHPEDRIALQHKWCEATEKREASDSEYRFLKSDGSVIWVLGRSIPEQNEKKQIIGYVGTVTDITDIKLYEIELNRLKEKAEESDRLKSAFLANMSHEIRTPMNGIMGLAELLKEPKLSGDEQQLYLDLIRESGARMLNIIRDIIDISRIEANQVKIKTSEVNINEETEYLFNFFKPETDKKGIELSLSNGLSGEDATIVTDKEKFTAILTNLVKNAIKYTNHGSISFGYTKKDHLLTFYVQDTGMGIPENRQKAIFDRFVQADLIDEYALEGAGIGLSIAKAYVEMLDGNIWVESKKDKGSTFYFSFAYITAVTS